MTMTDEVPHVSRRKHSRKKHRAHKMRRAVNVIGWSVLGLAMAALFITGAIYLVLSMRGEGSGVPTTQPARPGLPPG